MMHIFLSYRRADTADVSGRLYDNLRMKFGEELVFRDVYSIHLGANWREHIDDFLKETDVVLAIMGPNWLMAKDANGRRRLDDPEDNVRKELELAIKLGVPIIPVLVGGATVPQRDDFPESLERLYYLNAAPIRDTDFEYDFERLVKAIQKYARQKEPRNLERSKFGVEMKRSGDVVAAPGDPRQVFLKPTTKPPSRISTVVLMVGFGIMIIIIILVLMLGHR